MIKVICICDICGAPHRQSNNEKYRIVREFNGRREESRPLDLCRECINKLYGIVKEGEPSF